MSEELVEKVAEAIWLAEAARSNRRRYILWADAGDTMRDNYRPLARAVLSVIREDEFTVVPSDIRRAFYYPIEMPVTADGHGPATVGVDAVKITYEVWDRLLNSHGSYDNLPDAINQAIALNSRAMIAASPIGEK